jgi:putative transposase
VRRRLNHALPPWVTVHSTFFITINAHERGINHFCRPDVGNDILDSIRKYQDEEKWYCSIALLMPDHLHMIVSMGDGHDLSKTFGAWKRWLKMKHSLKWQRNFFEHRLQDDESEYEKRCYIMNNPVRAGLANKQGDWRWMWSAWPH